MSDSAGQPLLVLRKVGLLLDVLEQSGWELTTPQIAEASGLPPSTCRRLLRNLVAEEFLERDGDRYRPGRHLTRRTAASDQDALVRTAQPVLDRLRDETGETALLFVRDGRSRSLAAVAPTRHPVVYAVAVGQLMPLHAGSAGRVLLAHDPEATLDTLAEDLVAYTPNTLADPFALQAELAEVRRRGYATSVEERAPGASGTSAPVFGAAAGIVAALGIAGPRERLSVEAMAQHRPSVLRAAQELSRALGHQGHEGHQGHPGDQDAPAPATSTDQEVHRWQRTTR